jgi:signal peptidase II
MAGTVVDQATKILAFTYLEHGEYRRIVPYVLGLVRSENAGALFGIMPGRGVLLALLSLAALGLILFFLYRTPSKGAWMPVAFGLIAAGAAGNFIDRVFNDGRVKDFIDLHIGPHEWDQWWSHWPTFNVADAFICIGIAMILYAELRKPKAAARSTTAQSR